MPKAIVCVATGRESDWEAFCLDFDLAVQGKSFEEVRVSLGRAIDMYFRSALAEPEHIRSRLLARKAPFFGPPNVGLSRLLVDSLNSCYSP